MDENEPEFHQRIMTRVVKFIGAGQRQTRLSGFQFWRWL